MGMSGKFFWEVSRKGLNVYVLMGEIFGDRFDLRVVVNVLEVVKKFISFDFSIEFFF